MQSNTKPWHTPIDLTNLGKSESKDVISPLNEALVEYVNNPNRDDNKKYLSLIIDLCEKYFTSIPLERRLNKEDYYQPWEEALPEWPHAMQILEIQKKAVSLLFLPDATNDAQARWKLLSEILGPTPGGKVGKALDKNYFKEFKFKGNEGIYAWIIGYSQATNLLSYRESISRGQKTIITYLDNPEDYLVSFNESKLFYRGKPLDAKPSKYEECIIVADLNGNVYVSDPDSNDLQLSFHHSSFLQGKPVLFAGTIVADQGQITKISAESGHYKPSRKELLKFLELLQTKHNIDLSTIVVVDGPNGQPKNGLKYLLTKGYCLPLDKETYVKNAQTNLLLREIAIAEAKQQWKTCEGLIEDAIKKGIESAIYKKATLIAENNDIYSSIPFDERTKFAINLLENMISTMKPSRLQLEVQRTLAELQIRLKVEMEERKTRKSDVSAITDKQPPTPMPVASKGSLNSGPGSPMLFSKALSRLISKPSIDTNAEKNVPQKGPQKK